MRRVAGTAIWVVSTGIAAWRVMTRAGDDKIVTSLIVWRLGPLQLSTIYHGSASMLAAARAITSNAGSSAGTRS